MSGFTPIVDGPARPARHRVRCPPESGALDATGSRQLGAGVSPAVRRELDALLRYAHAIADTAPRERREDAADAARCYMGGALTVLEHLDLVSGEEYAEWWERLMARLPG